MGVFGKINQGKHPNIVAHRKAIGAQSATEKSIRKPLGKKSAGGGDHYKATPGHALLFTISLNPEDLSLLAIIPCQQYLSTGFPSGPQCCLPFSL